MEIEDEEGVRGMEYRRAEVAEVEESEEDEESYSWVERIVPSLSHDMVHRSWRTPMSDDSRHSRSSVLGYVIHRSSLPGAYLPD